MEHTANPYTYISSSFLPTLNWLHISVACWKVTWSRDIYATAFLGNITWIMLKLFNVTIALGHSGPKVCFSPGNILLMAKQEIAEMGSWFSISKGSKSRVCKLSDILFLSAEASGTAVEGDLEQNCSLVHFMSSLHTNLACIERPFPCFSTIYTQLRKHLGYMAGKDLQIH